MNQGWGSALCPLKFLRPAVSGNLEEGPSVDCCPSGSMPCLGVFGFFLSGFVVPLDGFVKCAAVLV